MTAHYKIVCAAHGTVLGQCLCPADDKPIRWNLCPDNSLPGSQNEHRQAHACRFVKRRGRVSNVERHRINALFGTIMASLITDTVIMHLYKQLEQR